MIRVSEPEWVHPFEGLLVAGTYRVTRRLGGGGLGEVHEAEHARLRSPVAIKFLRTGALTDRRSRERFHHEARRVAALCSENVVKVFDCGELDDGTPYLVMERLFGEDLRALLARERALPVRRAVQLVLGACRGLAPVHAAGIVHRDLKPANLFITRGPHATELCKIIDFGAAKAPEGDSTRPGALIGTVRYMAPEQLENAASATARADIYALGAILYEALTGVMAHTGDTLEEIMFDIVHRDPKPPSVHRVVPPALDRAVLRALSRSPSERFANTEEFARALAPFGPLERIGEPAHEFDAETLTDKDELASRNRRRRMVATVPVIWMGTLAYGLGLFSGWMLRGSPFPKPATARVTLVPEAMAHLAVNTTTTPGAALNHAAPSATMAVAIPAVTRPTVSVPTVSVPAVSVPAVSARASKRVALPRVTGTAPERALLDRFDARDPYE